MKRIVYGAIVALALAGTGLSAYAAEEGSWAVKPTIPSAQQLFPPGAVRMLDGPFKAMQEVDAAYLMALEPDRLLALFRSEAGLQPKAKPYGGWESPAAPGKTHSLAGHSLGHYLSALSLMYRMTGEERYKERVLAITKELKECQDKRGDGSLVAFPALRELEADIRAGKVETIHKYWAPFYTIHKEMAGLRDAWLWCNDATAKQVLAGMSDWCGSVVKGLSDDTREQMLKAEHGGMAEVLADAYAITGEKKYLEYARLYSHHLVMDPLAEGKDTLTGMHANTQIPKFVGFQRIHEMAGDEKAGAAAAFFWKTVVENRTWANGGNSIHEHFPNPKDMAGDLTHDGGPETCNTYNMLKLTAALFREKPDMGYVDFYENAMFNHILPSQAPLPGAGAFVYYTPLRPDYARSYGTAFGSFWCCTGTGMENHARYGEMTYSHDAKALTVNFFMASELKWADRGLSLKQETRFPDEAATKLTIVAAPADEMTLRIRHPFWLGAEKMAIRVNDQPVEVSSKAGGYAEITRPWKAGDRVQVDLPMKVRVVRMPQTPEYVSLFYGPVLLAGQLGSEGLVQNDFIGPYTPLKALQPLAKAPMIVAGGDGEILSHLAPVADKPAEFKTSGLVKPADVTLAPFYRTHFQRYAIYWRQTDQARWETQAKQIAEAEKAERELDARTIDRVRAGEQQPETDHNMKFEKSGAGVGNQARHFREARDGGWFSYEMKAPAAGGKSAVRVMYFGWDGDREFEIQVEGTKIATVKLNGGKDDYYAVDYPIPDDLTTGKEKVTVRFQAPAGKAVGRVFDVRVVTVK